MRIMRSGAVAGAVLATATAAQAAPPPASAFGRLPAVQSASISPDGAAVAMIGGAPDKRILSIAGLDGSEPVAVDLGDVRTSYVRWAGDGYLLARVTKYGKPNWSKYTYNFSRDLIFDRKGAFKTWLLAKNAETGLYDEPALIKVVGGDKPVAYVAAGSIWKVDVASGWGKVLTSDFGYDWAFDMNGVAQARMSSGSLGALVQVRRGMGWSVVATQKEKGADILGYSDPENEVYFTEEDGEHGLPKLRKVQVADGKVTELGAPAGEISVLFDPYNGQAVAITRTDSATAYEWLDPKLGAAYAAMRKAMKGQDVQPVSWSKDRSRMVVRVGSGDDPANWYLFDAARHELSALGEEYPELKGVALGRKTFMRYRSRDGLDIPAYLHLPAGGQTKNLPLIVLPHGGPNARDDSDFDWWPQFLASRGYAVLQPQFRGSDGWGYDLRHAGKQEWAGKMQTDLIDGIAALAKDGTVDPKRVCIMGASYGGYAALEAMTAHPDDYRCAVSVNGISDPGEFILQLNRMFTVDTGMLRATYGDNAAEIAAAAPAKHVSSVTGPILLIRSAQDTTVPPAQSTEMLDKLTKAGKPAQMVELPGDDHHLMTSASRTRMLEAIDVFLAKNLPVG